MSGESGWSDALFEGFSSKAPSDNTKEVKVIETVKVEEKPVEI